MSISAFLPLLYAMVCGLILNVILRQVLRAGPERRAWGTGRARPSRTERREIRRAVRAGMPVSDRRLAGPAIRFGEEFRTSMARLWFSRGKRPRWLFVFGRIFFPVMGVLALASGVNDGDPMEALSGVLLLGFTVLYLPVTERWMLARRARRDRRISDSIDANRRLLPEASGPYFGHP